jgi:peptidoglycan biosynthesis protein MviN/MurJ (putative lipid II flippase)
MELNYILKFLGVMLSMTLADICWAYYFIKIEERKSIAAGIWASLIYIFGALTVTSSMDDRSLIIAAVIGSFIGTALTVEYKKRKENKKAQD